MPMPVPIQNQADGKGIFLLHTPMSHLGFARSDAVLSAFERISAALMTASSRP